MKVTTGINGVDQLLYGGIPQGRSLLVAGQPGTGKTIFGLQFLLAGLKKGEKGICVTLDQQAKHIIADATSLGWNLNRYLKNNTLKILDLTHYFSHPEKNTTDGFDCLQIIDDIQRFITKFGASRILIDPISPLVFSHCHTLDVIEYIRKLIFTLESKVTCTSVLTSYVKVGNTNYSQHSVESFAAAGIVVLELIKQDHHWTRMVSARKMRGSDIKLTEQPFTIQKKTGLTVEPTS